MVFLSQCGKLAIADFGALAYMVSENITCQTLHRRLFANRVLFDKRASSLVTGTDRTLLLFEGRLQILRTHDERLHLVIVAFLILLAATAGDRKTILRLAVRRPGGSFNLST